MSQKLLQKIAVLMIEDAEDYAELVRFYVDKAGPSRISLDVAASLAEGIKRYKQGGIDLILLDLNLPDSAGLETLSRLREEAPEVPLVVLTGTVDSDIGLSALRMGAQDYLVKKNMDPDSLVRSLIYSCESVRAEQARRKAENAEKRIFRAILENAPMGIWRLDKNLKVVEVNPKGLAQLGKAAAEILGKCFFNDILGLDKTIVESRLAAEQVFKGEEHKMTLGAEAGCVSTYWDFTVWPLWSDQENGAGAMAVTVEVTERVRLAQQREDFMATLAHDLKTPLTGADRAIGLMLEGVLGEISQAQSQFLHMLRQNNQALLSMVQNLLEIYRYETGAAVLNMAPFDLVALAASCLAESTLLAEAQKLKLDFPRAEKLEVKADASAVRLLLVNLLDNCIRYTPAGGAIEMQVRKAGATIILSVKDRGRALSAEERENLFERFWQGDGYHSTGIGLELYLCRKIAEAHGGALDCISEADQATFSLKLPLAAKT